MDNDLAEWSGRVLAREPDPDFARLADVLAGRDPGRRVLFEFFFGDAVHAFVNGRPCPEAPADRIAWWNETYRRCGYDYAVVTGNQLGFDFPHRRRLGRDDADTHSINAGDDITSWAECATYAWPDPAAAAWDLLDRVPPPAGMRYLVSGPGGVLENTIRLVGYERLCLLSVDDPALLDEVFARVGGCLLGMYERAVAHPAVGAVIGNDDWGFKTQPMLTPDQMRRWVTPWHRRIVATAHAAGKPAILHSCGNLATLIDDIVDDLGYDARHSYEDVITPVEEAWERWGGRLAILGGIDLDFLCRETPAAVHARAGAMVAKTGCRRYALGSGNSIPDYVPLANFFAMIA